MLNFRNFFVFLILFMSAPSVFSKDIRFAQVTDLRYSAENSQIAENIVRDINKQKQIEFVVFTGDNIEKADTENLKGFVTEIKKIKCPCYVVIGDKDVNRHKDLSKKQYSAYLKKHIKHYKPSTPNYIFEKNGLVFIVADGAKDVIPSTNGFYKDNVVEWVDANLDLYSKKPVIIMQHFPLIPPSERETYITFKPEKYLEVLQKHKNVKAVISGHFGINKEEKVDGIVHISTASAPYYRVIDILDYDSDNPTIWGEIKKAE